MLNRVALRNQHDAKMTRIIMLSYGLLWGTAADNIEKTQNTDVHSVLWNLHVSQWRTIHSLALQSRKNIRCKLWHVPNTSVTGLRPYEHHIASLGECVCRCSASNAPTLRWQQIENRCEHLSFRPHLLTRHDNDDNGRSWGSKLALCIILWRATYCQAEARQKPQDASTSTVNSLQCM